MSPRTATIGTAAWARWVVSADLAYEIDPRELPATWHFSRFELGCSEAAWCRQQAATGTESYELDQSTVTAALKTSKGVTLADDSIVNTYREHFGAGSMARSAPTVTQCDAVAADTYWQGVHMDAFAHWWMRQWTNGTGRFCMSDMEDAGYAEAMRRLSQQGRARWDHFLILRAGSDFDEQYAGQSALASLTEGHLIGGARLASENGYAVASAVADKIETSGSP